MNPLTHTPPALNLNVEVGIETPENGDCYDADSGEFLGTLDPLVNTETKHITIELTILHEGEMYVFKLSHKYKDEE